MESLEAMLADGVRFHPLYPPSFNADHLPMTLTAMSRLGAHVETMARYRNSYCKILKEIEPAPPMSDWRAGRGRIECYPGLLAMMQEEVEQRGAIDCIREYGPIGIPGLASDAFHPMIRLGFAITSGSNAEVAAALAYMIARELDVPVDSSQPLDLAEVLEEQARAPVTLKGQRFGDRVRFLVDEGTYPVGTASNFAECAAVSLDVYRSTRNFFALHMVTGTQAARICATVLDEQLVLASLTGALLAAHRVLDSPSFDRHSPMPIPDRLDREHTFKYVYACLDEHRAHGDARYIDEIVGFRDAGLVPAWAAASDC